MLTCLATGHLQIRGQVGRQWYKAMRMQRSEQTAKARDHKLQAAAGIIQRYHNLAKPLCHGSHEDTRRVEASTVNGHGLMLRVP